MSSGNGSIISTAQYAKVKRTMPTTIVANGWSVLSAPIAPIKVLRKKGKKKVGWLKKKIAKWAQEGREDCVDYEPTSKASSNGGVSGKSSVRFTVYAASGGYIIEHYKQDRYRESDGPELTIVNTGESLGTAVEHILTMESLKA